MKQILFLLSIAFALATSCITEPEMISSADKIPVSLEIANPQIIPEGSKSSYTTEEVNRLTDLNILVYHSGSLIGRCSRYFNNTTNITMDLPDKLDGFNIYLVANTGNITAYAPEQERDMEEFRYIAKSYKDFHTKGFPMANKIENYRKDTPANFKLIRMVGQYSFTVKTKATDAEYTIKKVRLRNCALDIYPFSKTPIRASHFALQDDYQNENPGDYLNNEDIARLNNGLPVELYFLENMQGTLLPGNTDPTKKNPTELKNPTIAAHCTYLEIVADVKTPAGLYSNGKYRYYLGGDNVTNFDIRRNRKYILNVRMAQDMVTEDGWRIEVAPPVVIGKVQTDKDIAKVINGVEDMIFITTESGNHAALDYTIEYAAEGLINNSLVRSTLPESAINYSIKTENVRGKMLKGVHITCNEPIIGTISNFGTTPEPDGKVILAIKSKDKYNGNSVLVKHVQVNVYKRAFPIIFKKNPADQKLYVYIENPLNLNFRIGVYERQKHFYDIETKTNRVADGDFYRIFSNEEYCDNNGEWVKPCDKQAWYKLSNCPSMAYSTAMVRHDKADWSKFNLIDDRANEKYIRVFIEPLSGPHHITSSSYFSVMCTDGKLHKLMPNVSCYTPYPRFISGRHDLMDMSRSKKQLSPQLTGNVNIKCYPQELQSVPENVVVQIHGYSSGSYSVNEQGLIGSYGIRGVGFALGNQMFNIFNNVNDSRAPLSDKQPFYIANGIATVIKMDVYNDEPTRAGEKNATLRGFWTELYGPGRDVEETPASTHKAEYFTKNLKQFGGNIHRWFINKNYLFTGTHMTINDYISWPHGSTMPNGVTVPNKITFNKP